MRDYIVSQIELAFREKYTKEERVLTLAELAEVAVDAYQEAEKLRNVGLD